jgi:hypothetical protein
MERGTASCTQKFENSHKKWFYIRMRIIEDYRLDHFLRISILLYLTTHSEFGLAAFYVCNVEGIINTPDWRIKFLHCQNICQKKTTLHVSTSDMHCSLARYALKSNQSYPDPSKS